jgi:uncharacterized membrane protein
VSSFALGFVFALLGAAIVLATRQGTPGAAAVGAVTAFSMVLGAGAAVMAPVALFVLGSGVLTRLGRARKERSGAAEANRGRRSALHVAAKLGVPALLGLAAWLRPEWRLLCGLGIAASLAGAFADTAATEAGPLARGPVVRLRGFNVTRAQHGVPGGMSAAGIVVSAIAALAIGVLSASLAIVEGRSGAALVSASGFAAPLVESAIADSPLGRALGHFGRNGFLSALAAALAMGASAVSGIGR